MNEREQLLKDHIASAFNEVHQGERMAIKAKIWDTLPLSDEDINHFKKTLYFWSTVPTEEGNITGFWIGEAMREPDKLTKMLVIIDVSLDVYDWLKENVYHINE